MIFQAFKDYKRVLIALFIQFIYTLLWTLLLFVLGIIKGLSYSLSLYILRDNPQISPSEAISESQRMMQGHKMDMFLLSLSFFGWAFLAILSLGIGLLWFYPYMSATIAVFYEKLKTESLDIQSV